MVKSLSGCILKYTLEESSAKFIVLFLRENLGIAATPHPTPLPYRGQIRAVGKQSMISVHRGVGWFNGREIL